MTAGRLSNTQSNKTTTMMLVNSFVFVSLTLPFTLVVFIMQEFTVLDDIVGFIVYMIFNALIHVNHAINCLLYCISGTVFRRELKLLFVALFSKVKCSGSAENAVV